MLMIAVVKTVVGGMKIVSVDMTMNVVETVSVVETASDGMMWIAVTAVEDYLLKHLDCLHLQ